MSLLRSTSFSFGQQANSGTGFGAAASTSAAGSNPTANAAAGPSFSFGGASNANAQSQQQQAKPSLFSFGGGAQPQQQQQGSTTSGGGLFGQPQQQQQSGTTGGGLFGQPQQQTGNTAGGGLFGQAQQQTNNTAGGGLFGQSQQQQKPPTLTLTGPQSTNSGFGSSLFGQQQQQQPQQQQQLGGGLFGSSATNNASATQNKSLFSFGQPSQQSQQQPQQNQQQLGSSLFGASQGQMGNNAQGFSTIGGASQNNQGGFASQPLYQKERFNDLSEGMQSLLEQMEKHIGEQIRIKEELGSRDYGEEIKRRAAEWKDLRNGLNDTLLILQQDGDLISGVVENVQRDRVDLATLYDIARNYKEGKSDGKQWLSWPGEFFTKSALEFRQRIKRYRSTIEEIERQLATLDTRNEHSPQLISDAIVHQHSIFMSLAANVAGLHGEVDQLKREYTQWYQQQYRSVRDPFAMSQLTATI